MIVFDASTLILLAKIGILQTVLSKYQGVIPESVKEEVTYKKDVDTELIVQQIKDGNLIIEKNPEKDNREERKKNQN